jgi:2-methylcitrate dehydratase PrpD
VTTLSRTLAQLCRRPVPDALVQRARWHLIDWLGCSALGAAQPETRPLLAGLSLDAAGVPGVSGLPADPWHALLYAASLGNVLEMDDIHRDAIVHSGPVVVPAALFLGHALGASLHDILVAVVRGYEAMIRLGRCVGPGHYALWHNTATCGPTGAAAAAASLLGLSPDGWVHAFGHAATQSAGLWQVRLEPGLSKQWHVARAAQTGVQAALLARAGAAGPTRIFEGEKGFFAALCPDGDASRLCEPLADDWCMLQTSFKPWPACRHAHAGIDAALRVATRAGLGIDTCRRERVGQIDSVQVHTYADALAFCDRVHPATPAQARFSLQHAVAVCLLSGPPGLEDFQPAGLANPQLAALREKVSLHVADPWNARYPAHYGAAVTVSLRSGHVHRAQVDDALGDPERPMSTGQILQKARTLLAAAHWPASVSEPCLAYCLDDDYQGPAPDLCSVLVRQAPHSLCSEGQESS